MHTDTLLSLADGERAGVRLDLLLRALGRRGGRRLGRGRGDGRGFARGAALADLRQGALVRLGGARRRLDFCHVLRSHFSQKKLLEWCQM